MIGKPGETKEINHKVGKTDFHALAQAEGSWMTKDEETQREIAELPNIARDREKQIFTTD